MTERMTVAEFLAMPGDTSHLELQDGQVVQRGVWLARQCRVANGLAALLRGVSRGRFEVYIKVPFRALPEYELRDADVAAVTPERWAEALAQDAVAGAPDLVAEVLSPTRGLVDLLQYERLCLANGCREFWWVDTRANEVRVTTADGVRIYRAGMEIPVVILDGERIAVDAIFAR
ncbi:MAG: Uma2 family endonuclease [Bryobacterales bacterium]|nr:Uma2 family endonuclease [Bryobacterales bacterium]